MEVVGSIQELQEKIVEGKLEGDFIHRPHVDEIKFWMCGSTQELLDGPPYTILRKKRCLKIGIPTSSLLRAMIRPEDGFTPKWAAE
jgi:hypothetical protein